MSIQHHDDHYKPDQTPHEELKMYFETLKKVDELGDALLSQARPVARDSFYRVSNPALIALIDMPVELKTMELFAIVFEFQGAEKDGKVFSSVHLALEFKQGTCRLSQPSPASHTAPYEFIADSVYNGNPSQNISTGSITSKEFSDIVARALRPNDDPDHADYTHVDIANIRDEIAAVLDRNDEVSSSKFYVFEQDGHKIIVCVNDGHIHEISITQVGLENDKTHVTLRTTFDTSAHGQELFISDENGSHPHTLDATEIQAFHDIIDDLLDSLRPQDASLEMLDNEEIVRPVFSQEQP